MPADDANAAEESAKEVEATAKVLASTVDEADSHQTAPTDDDGDDQQQQQQQRQNKDRAADGDSCDDRADRLEEAARAPQPTPEPPTTGSRPASPSQTAPSQESTLQATNLPAKYGDNLSDSDGRDLGRKGSSVSFQTTCDLYEIDLVQPEEKPPRLKPSVFNSVRYYVMLLALLSPFVTTYSRTIINFAITDMIDPECVQDKRSHQTTTTPATIIGPSPSNSNNPAEMHNNCSMAYFDVDNSCPVDEADRARLIEGNKKDIERARTSVGEKFKWDTWYQGLLKSAYAVGHAPFQIPGSRLSERYGSHWVMTISSSVIAVLCLLAPFLAAAHFWLLYLDLFMLGVLGSFMTPALITLFTNWLTPGEKTITLSFYLIASRLGYALSSILCGLLISAQLSWRYVFFSAGVISIAFSAMFIVFARSRPQDHPLISRAELEYLATKNTLVRESLARRRAREQLARQDEKAKQQFEMKLTNNGLSIDSAPTQVAPPPAQDPEKQQPVRGNKHQAPWFAILTNVPVWAFIITKFCVKLAGDTVQIELPTYLNRVMHYGPKENGKINAWIYVIFCIGCLVVGALAKSISKSRPFGLSKTAIRKIFQCIASFGVSLAIVGLAFSVCNKSSTEFYLMLIFFVTTFGTGGEAQIPLDISERYAGTIHAMGSSLAISSAIEPMLVGFLMRGHAADKESWKNVWLGAGSIASFGGLVFLFFADAKIQPFDHIGTDQNNTEVEKGQALKEKPASVDDNNNNISDDKPATEKPVGSDNKAFVRDIGTSLGGEEQKAGFRESVEI